MFGRVAKRGFSPDGSGILYLFGRKDKDTAYSGSGFPKDIRSLLLLKNMRLKP
ncbi:MAG: hypothetical protein KUL76_01005 [Kaistella sp.]|nr:hypothetical protein [Kaistella sp.]